MGERRAGADNRGCLVVAPAVVAWPTVVVTAVVAVVLVQYEPFKASANQLLTYQAPPDTQAAQET